MPTSEEQLRIATKLRVAMGVKPRFSWLKAIGKGLVTAGKGALVIAPIILEEVVPVLKGAGVHISEGIIVALALAKIANNHRKNKDN